MINTTTNKNDQVQALLISPDDSGGDVSTPVVTPFVITQRKPSPKQ
jgi:hypothetical protein